MNGGRSGGAAGIACSILIFAMVAAVLAITGSGASERLAGETEQEAEQPESLSRGELTRIAVDATPSVARRVAEIRGHEFDELPEPEVVSSEYLNRLSRREERRGGGGGGISVGEAELRMTGMLAPDEELEDASGSTGDLAAAAYDPRTDRLYVVRDASAVPNRALVEFLLAHELDHALEDQNFGIGGGANLSDDASLARQALIEGLATAVMQDYATRYLDPFDLLAGADGIDTDTHGVPQVLVDVLTWTYLGGNDYVTSCASSRTVGSSSTTRCVPPAGNNRAGAAPGEVRAGRTAESGPREPCGDCVRRVTSWPIAASSASCRPRICCAWVPLRPQPTSRRRAGMAIATNSGARPAPNCATAPIRVATVSSS